MSASLRVSSQPRASHRHCSRARPPARRGAGAALALLLTLLTMAPLGAAVGNLEDYEFRNQDVRDVLATIAAEEDLNIVYAPGLLTDVHDQPLLVSAQLEDVSPREAVIAVVQAAGLRFEERGHDILVVKPSLERVWSDLLRKHGRHHDHDVEFEGHDDRP